MTDIEKNLSSPIEQAPNIDLTLSYEVQHLALEKSSASLNTC
jgi:hypothetical protein